METPTKQISRITSGSNTSNIVFDFKINGYVDTVHAQSLKEAITRAYYKYVSSFMNPQHMGFKVELEKARHEPIKIDLSSDEKEKYFDDFSRAYINKGDVHQSVLDKIEQIQKIMRDIKQHGN